MAPKKSFIWQMFEQCLESVVTVICNICSAKVSRGTLGNMGTPGMRQHGQRNHLMKYQEIEKKAKESVLPLPHDAPPVYPEAESCGTAGLAGGELGQLKVIALANELSKAPRSSANDH